MKDKFQYTSNQLLFNQKRFEIRDTFCVPGEGDKFAVYDNEADDYYFDPGDHLYHTFDTHAEAFTYLKDEVLPRVAHLQSPNEYNFETADGAVGNLIDVTNEDWYKNPPMTLYDDLEYDCWNLLCQYAELVGLHLVKEEIDFHLAKSVQDHVMQLVEAEVGVKFPVYDADKRAQSLSDKIARAENQKSSSEAVTTEPENYKTQR